jgi:hypothetical protein
MVLVFSSTVKVMRKSSFIILNLYAMASAYWRANRESHKMEDLFIHRVGGKYHSRILDLFIVVAPMSTLPFGGCNGLLLGSGINNIIRCIRGAIMAQHY